MHLHFISYRSKSDYCDFHLLTASKRLAARRGEFQLGSNVPPKKFNNPVKKVLPGAGLRTSRLPIKGGVAISSNLFRHQTATKTVGSNRLQKGSSTVTSAKAIGTEETASDRITAGAGIDPKDSAQFQEALRLNTVGSRHVLTQLAKNETSGSQTKSSGTSIASAKAKITCKQFLTTQNPRSANQPSSLAKEAKAKVTLKTVISLSCYIGKLFLGKSHFRSSSSRRHSKNRRKDGKVENTKYGEPAKQRQC